MSKKPTHNKMTGKDVYICLDNTGEKGNLTMGKPYRLLAINRDYTFELYVLIKDDTLELGWYKLNKFRPRNER